MELRVRAEQLRTAAGAAVDAGILGVRVCPGERPLGRLPAEDGVLLGRQARPPLRVGQLDAAGSHLHHHQRDCDELRGRRGNHEEVKDLVEAKDTGNGFGHWVA